MGISQIVWLSFRLSILCRFLSVMADQRYYAIGGNYDIAILHDCFW